jgi:hypothetical protein
MKSRYFKIAVLLAVFSLAGCDDFFNINRDPNNPLDVPLNQLLPSIQVDAAGALGINSGGLSQIATTYVHHTVQRGNTINDYAAVGDDFGVATPWTIFYTRALQDIEEMISKAEETEATHYVGVGKIMKAYFYSILVDVYGDVPFSQACNAIEFPNPKYDLGEEIYPQLFTMLDEGIAALSGASTLSPDGDDLFYGGNLDQWRRFAKTVKLKMYNQVRLVQDVSDEVNALLAEEADLIINAGDDFQFNYNSGVSPDNRNPAYVQEWAPATAQYYMSPYFYEIMRNMNTFNHPDYGGKIDVEDPRVPYYFYNQIAEVTEDTPPENPCSYCYGYVKDDVFILSEPALQGTGVVAIHEFSDAIDPNAGFDQSRSQTVCGLYPLGGRYDNGAGGATNFNGHSSVAQRFLTAYAVRFIEAELYHTGVATGGAVKAREAFKKGIEAGFAKVNEIASSVEAPPIADAAITTYVNAVLVAYDGADDEGKLEHIITQKWIATFGWGVDAYTDYRRTGYPILFDGNTDDLPGTVRTREYPVAYPWSSANLAVNAEAPVQKIISSAEAKPFWMK